MYVLDTDHLSILERGGAEALRLTMRLGAVSDTEIATCIVVYEEQMRGWLAQGARAQTSDAWVMAYQDLTENLQVHCEMLQLPFDVRAATRFDELKKQKLISEPMT